MIALVRWVSLVAAVFVIVALNTAGPATPAGFVLAVVFFALFLIVCWSYGAFRKEIWVMDEPVTAPPSMWDERDEPRLIQ